MTFVALLTYFLTPIQNIINFQPQLQTAFVSIERLLDILELTPEPSAEEQKLSVSGKDIEFSNVDFRYVHISLFFTISICISHPVKKLRLWVKADVEKLRLSNFFYGFLTLKAAIFGSVNTIFALFPHSLFAARSLMYLKTLFSSVAVSVKIWKWESGKYRKRNLIKSVNCAVSNPLLILFLSAMIRLSVKMEIPSPAVRSSGLPLPAHCFDILLS